MLVVVVVIIAVVVVAVVVVVVVAVAASTKLGTIIIILITEWLRLCRRPFVSESDLWWSGGMEPGMPGCLVIVAAW